jgi:hypothetical protein
MYSSKDKLKVVILTNTIRVEGEMHLVSGTRLTDIVNVKTKDFFPITNAKIFADSGETLYDLDYVAINREEIVAIFPVGDMRT